LFVPLLPLPHDFTILTEVFMSHPNIESVIGIEAQRIAIFCRAVEGAAIGAGDIARGQQDAFQQQGDITIAAQFAAQFGEPFQPVRDVAMLAGTGTEVVDIHAAISPARQ
jgi:hypothetical protein